MIGKIIKIAGKKYKVVSDSSGDGLTIEPLENFIVNKPKDRIEELEERVAKLEIKLSNLVNALS